MDNLNILLVDDEEIIRLTVGNNLREAGYGVEVAENAQQACAMLDKKTYDLVLTDLVMEGGDGLQVLKKAKSIDLLCSVVLMTGYGSMNSAILALRDGAVDYILKPFENDELLFRISRCMQKRILQLELQKAEKELQKSHAALEKKVQDRTRLLQLEIKRNQEIQLELERKNHEITDRNTALRVLLEQQEKARRDLERTIMENLKKNLFPYLDLLQNKLKSREEEMLVSTIKVNLNKISSTFTQELSSARLNLTPREVQIAEMIRQGKSSKDIALVFNLSIGTVDFYRNNLRKKLGIRNRKISLRNYLLTFPPPHFLSHPEV
ncbi:MAG TPA: response regulator [Desulfobacteraceae bacterium]|nr:response regulator [Desulfobacteraceae bacterium]